MSLRWRTAAVVVLAAAAMVAGAGANSANAGEPDSATDHAAAFSATELTWLRAAKPVLAWARDQRLPLRVLVQPQDTPGQTPVGMAFVEGQRLLVLSMRGNPAVQATLDRLPAALQGPIVQAILAHALGHCLRHLQQVRARAGPVGSRAGRRFLSAAAALAAADQPPLSASRAWTRDSAAPKS
jgi:hypothetical protein